MITSILFEGLSFLLAVGLRDKDETEEAILSNGGTIVDALPADITIAPVDSVLIFLIL
jgi:hypothetical protein